MYVVNGSRLLQLFWGVTNQVALRVYKLDKFAFKVQISEWL